MSQKKLLTTEEVLDRLQLNVRTVYRLVKAGKLPAVRIGRQWRFRSGDIDVWVSRGGELVALLEAERPPATVRILAVDDEASVLKALVGYLTRAGYRADPAANGPAAIEALKSASYDLVITDHKMPGMNGLADNREARQLRPDIAALIVTGHSTEAMAIEAINLGVSGYLMKPVRSAALLAAVTRALGVPPADEKDAAIRPDVFQPE
jgi:excisionase family DNA binding protein